MRQAQAHDGSDAASAAFQRHYAHLVRLCFLLSGRRDVAEDIAQDAFVRVIPRVHALPEDEVGPYLRRIAVSVWKNRRRRLVLEARFRHRESMPIRAVEPDVAQHDALWTAVSRLPAKQRACIVLRYWEDLSVAEAANVLACSTGTIKSHTSRALAKLRRDVGDED